MKKFLDNKLNILMTAEQEKGYISERANRMLIYNRFFLIVIMAFQLYNIIYAFIYTNGKFHTLASRVYTILYTSLFLASLICFIFTIYFKKNFEKNVKNIIFMQTLYGIFLLAWSASVTVYDQRVSNNVSVYMITSLTIAMFVYFKPICAILVYGILDFALFWIIPLFKQGSDMYGINVNLTVMTAMCIIICIYHYYYDRKNYLYQQVINQKNYQLENLSIQDVLTGLKNRRFLENELDSLFNECREDRTDITFMMIDIDSFKSYNDLFGHIQGDECLRRISWRINHELDENCEYLVRYGGEEFLYIGIGVDEKSAKAKGNYFNKIIRELVMGPSQNEPMGITISIGVCTVDWNDQDPEWLEYINKADKALYIAKNSGKDRCVCFSDIMEGQLNTI